MSNTNLEKWLPSGEPGKSHLRRIQSGFFDLYVQGPVIIDLGYQGAEGIAARTFLPHAIGIDRGFPGYDGARLPFQDGTVNTVFSSHLLEHISEPVPAIQEQFRVLAPRGHIIIIVPHRDLYEKKLQPPSRWNLDHKRFYTPGRLLAEIEEALAPNFYRVRHLRDNDTNFDYAVPPTSHSGGCYEIELVIQKITPPMWELSGETT